MLDVWVLLFLLLSGVEASVEEEDIGQKHLRLRRASDDPDEPVVAYQQAIPETTMTEEQKEYLRWYYRTEDPTTWVFVLLGLAFMANKNRRKIAKYKAAVIVAQRSGDEELQVASSLRDNSKPSSPNGQLSDLRSGDIMVTWKDGNTSCLYSDSPAQGGEHEEKQEVVMVTEMSAHDEVKMSD